MRTVFGIAFLAIMGSAMAQTSISDLKCRTDLANAFQNLRVVDLNNPNAYSYGLRLDTSEVVGNRTTTYAGYLKLYDNSDPTAELLKSEMAIYNGNTLIQRTVADGRRVWSYDPIGNAYSVNAYNVESGTNAPKYRDNFVLLLKQTAAGTPQYLMTLMDQASITGTARVKDWLGGLPFAGLQTIDQNNPLMITEQIWQTVPDNTRYVQFNINSIDGGVTWNLDNIRIHKEDRLGSITKVTDTYLSQLKDQNGVAYSYPPSGTDFTFVPAPHSRVLASPRTVKF